MYNKHVMCGEHNKAQLITSFQSHIGIKGVVYDAKTKQPISNAIVHVANATGGQLMDIKHDITSGELFTHSCY